MSKYTPEELSEKAKAVLRAEAQGDPRAQMLYMALMQITRKNELTIRQYIWDIAHAGA